MSPGAGAAPPVPAAVPAGSVAVDAVDAGDSAPRRRHSAELYDAIWELEVPPIVVTDGKGAGRLNRDGGPTIAVGPTAVRLVLMAMARHTNPSRDQMLGPTSEWRCCPTVETIAQLAEVSERQVQRVLSAFVELGYIELERPGIRAGRNRAPRPTWWRLRPDLWPRRTVHGGDTGVVTTKSDLVMVATPASSPTMNGRDTGVIEMPMVATPVSPEPVRVKPVTPVQQRAPGDRKDDGPGHNVSLPRMSAMAMAAPGLMPAIPSLSVEDQAKELLSRYYEGLGANPGELTPPLRRREEVIASQLLEAGATPAEAEAFARDAIADGGRKGPIDGLRVFERERLGWRARRGRAERDGPRLVDRTGQPAEWELPVAASGGSS